MKQEEFTVDVAPEMEIYNVLQVLGYSIDTALAEFIDNSVQAFLNNKDTIHEDSRIEIHVSETANTISICDNAGGITRETMQHALTPAGISIAGGEHPKESLSVYGVGLKTASIWFTDHWSLETSPIGKSEKFTFDFNLPELLEKGSKTGTVLVDNEHKDKSYTKVTLHNIIRKLSKEDFENKIAPFILETFQKFLNYISINFFYEGIPLNANPKFLELTAPNSLIYMPVDKNGKHEHKCLVDWRLNDLKIDYKGIPVTGFFLIRETGSYEQAGIRLLRNNRVIEGTSVYPNYPPALVKTKNKFSAQRLYGEFHLDGFDVDFMKTRFSDDLDEFYTILSQKIKTEYNVNLFWQAEKYRARQREEELFEKLSRAKIHAIIDESQKKLNYRELGETAEHDDVNSSINEADLNTEQTGFNFNNESPSRENSNNSMSADLGNKPNNRHQNNPATSTLGTENSDNCTPVKITKIERNSDPNKIVFSDEAAKLIMELDSDKLIDLASSLQNVPWTTNPTLITVGVWALWETICKQMGAQDGAAIDHFLNPKIDMWYNKKDPRRKSMKEAIEEIRKKGNCSKHSLHNFNKDASNLNPYMKELDPVLVKCLNFLIEEKNAKKVS